MEFIETPSFTRCVLALMDDDDYACLQATLALRPDLGKVIPGGGGIRKMRWAGSGRGKRGGLRVIRSGLAPGDRVIIDGLMHAIPGAKVDPEKGTIRYDAAADGQG